MNMRRIVVGWIAALLFAVPGVAAGPVDVQSNRIVFMDGKEFVPRFVTGLPTTLVVPAGQTATMPETGVFDAIEVAGTLRVRRTGDTSVSFTHLQILPGGTLDVGTAADPIPCQFKVTLTIRDVPIDTSRDPLQWGNGILNFGHQSRVGCQKTEWTTLTAGVSAGATQVRVSEASNWAVGDKLFFPDMKQLNQNRNITYRVESSVAIAAINGDIITLSKPLDFEHQPILDTDGETVLMPRVANLTRNIVIRSENPNGTRGHTADVAHATWDVRYNAELGLGRTKNIALDNTVLNPDLSVVRVGSNMVGRYCNHHHHVHGPGVRNCIGNVLIALSDGVVSKWGDSVHSSSDTVHDGNIALGFPGAGFVTEDGPETRNVYRRNVGALSAGNGKNPQSNIQQLNCPGCEGSGLWFRGIKNVIDQNEGWNNAIGLNLITTGAVLTAKVPSAPGGMPDTSFDPRFAVPISIDGNVTFSNATNGSEVWSTQAPFFWTNLISAHNGAAQFFGGQSQDVHAMVRGAKLICNPTDVLNSRTVAFGSNSAYVAVGIIEDSQLDGCFEGVHAGGAGRTFKIVRTTMKNLTNINFPSAPLNNPEPPLFEDVMHEQLGSHPKRFIVWGSGNVWLPTQPKPFVEGRTINPAQGTRGHIINWQGTGQDYSLFTALQKRSAAAVPSHRSALFMPPEAGLTVGQAWDKYGIAWGAEALDDAAAMTRDGLINGFVRPDLTPDLGSPKYVVTYPSMQEPATVVVVNGQARIQMRGLLTGDHTGTRRDAALVSIDGGPQFLVTRTQGQFFDELSFNTNVASQGSHSLVTWRVDTNGNRIDASRLEHRGYFVGEQTTPPPTSEVGLCSDTIDNDKDGLTDAADPDCQTDPNPEEPPPTGETLLSTGGTVSAVNVTQPTRLFDGQPTEAEVRPLEGWAQYSITAPATLTRYAVQTRGLYGTMNPRAWRVEGSPDGTFWTELDSQVGQVFAPSETKSYPVSAAGPFSHFRITFTEANGSDRIQLREVAFYGVR